jgi:putative OmpL-like beta-barrel porin-2
MFLGLLSTGFAQDAPAAKPTDQPAATQTATPVPAAEPAAPAPLPTPSVVGPLAAALPITLEAGPLGKLSLNGIVSGMGLFQSNSVPGNEGANGALSNGQVWIQKTDGWWQFYVQAGAYQLSSLGSAFASTETDMTDLYGPVPTAYLKLVPGKTTNILIGILPTLVGAEYTFSFQNMNIERGLLWNQENAITRGIQLNQTFGKFSASFSWNDGYYSNRYSGLSGSLNYTKGPHSVTFVGLGYLGQTDWTNFATPVQNNGQIYNLIYTFSKNGWILTPYIQYNVVPTQPKIGVPQGASAWGGAVLASKTLKKGWSMAGRFEYISSSGGVPSNSLNLLYGPGSAAWSITATPTWQYQKFFARGDISFVQALSSTPGFAFGQAGTSNTQTRGVVELGFLF